MNPFGVENGPIETREIRPRERYALYGPAKARGPDTNLVFLKHALECLHCFWLLVLACFFAARITLPRHAQERRAPGAPGVAVLLRQSDRRCGHFL